MNGMEDLECFDIFELDPAVIRFNVLENLRLKATLLGKDIINLKSSKNFENFDSTLDKATSKWFSTFNDYFDLLECALNAKKN